MIDLGRIERLKDTVIALFETAVTDPSLRKIWIDDAKGAYYQLVVVEGILGDRPLDAERAARVRSAFSLAESRMKQVASEIASLSASPLELERNLRTELAAIEGAIAVRIDPFLARPPPPAALPARVIRRSDCEYTLPCRVCGKIAMVVRAGRAEPPLSMSAADQLVIDGVTGSGTYFVSADHAAPLLAALAAADLPRAHALAGELVPGGLSGYCPACDQVYCGDELRLEEEYDDGFYDCTYGTCPAGHRRLVDD